MISKALWFAAVACAISCLVFLGCEEATSLAENDGSPTGNTYTINGFWDFDVNGSNAISGGADWDTQNINFEDSLLVSDGFYELDNDPEIAERAFVNLTPFDIGNFTVAIKVAPDNTSGSSYMPIIVGGRLYRWFIIRLDSTGGLFVEFNNHETIYDVGTILSSNQMYKIVIMVDTTEHQFTV